MGPATVDFANFAAGDDATRLSISQQFVTSLKDHGAARLLNCDVSEGTLTQYLQLAAPFFALPLHVKQRIAITPRPEPERGYGAEGSEPLSNLDRRAQGENSSKRSEVMDVREHFDAGPPGDKRFPNAFPNETELPHFEQAMASYWTIFQQASSQLLEAIELGLNLPKDALLSLCREPCSELRFNYYPKVPLDVLAAGGKQRAAPHSDIGIISLLFQDDVGGLEIEDRRNSTVEHRCFVPVPAAGSRDVVLLVGDTLGRWTNGVIKAAVHRYRLQMMALQSRMEKSPTDTVPNVTLGHSSPSPTLRRLLRRWPSSVDQTVSRISRTWLIIKDGWGKSTESEGAVH